MSVIYQLLTLVQRQCLGSFLLGSLPSKSVSGLLGALVSVRFLGLSKCSRFYSAFQLGTLWVKDTSFSQGSRKPATHFPQAQSARLAVGEGRKGGLWVENEFPKKQR